MMEQKCASIIHDLGTNARISEYECSCAVLEGDLKKAEVAAKKAKVFRDSLMKIAEQFLAEEENARS